ncbi:hypothetical protein [Nostoc sp.]|uniref:hypothetical protein n=1 Tax=Nostoc sp. TaxID=1180 RepID=UPI002FF7255A
MFGFRDCDRFPLLKIWDRIIRLILEKSTYLKSLLFIVMAIAAKMNDEKALTLVIF